MYIDFSKLAKTLKVFGTIMAPPLIDFITTLEIIEEKAYKSTVLTILTIEIL